MFDFDCALFVSLCLLSYEVVTAIVATAKRDFSIVSDRYVLKQSLYFY